MYFVSTNIEKNLTPERARNQQDFVNNRKRLIRAFFILIEAILNLIELEALNQGYGGETRTGMNNFGKNKYRRMYIPKIRRR